jgi:hypothetical protein
MNLRLDKRAWLGGGAAAAVLIAVVSWFMVISPERSSTASLGTATSDAQLQNAITQAKVTKLRRQAENVDQLQSRLAAALEALPKASGLPAFTRQLNAQALVSKVDVTSIVIGAISSTESAVPAPTATAGTSNSATTSTPAPPAASGPTSATGGTYAIPVTIISTGSLTHELAFLKAIQTVGPRRVLVNSAVFAPGGSSQLAAIDKSTAVTAQLTVFSAP